MADIAEGIVRMCNITLLNTMARPFCNGTRTRRPRLSTGVTPLSTRTPRLSARTPRLSRRPGLPTREPPLSACYTCNMSCIFKAVELAYIIGVIANILVIIRVILDKKLHKPTFIAIACLAISDTLFVTSEIVLATEVVIKSFTECPKSGSHIRGGIYAIVTGTCWFAANGHLALLAVVRFVIIVFPLKAHMYLTIKKVIVSSVCIWVVSLIVFTGRFIDNKVHGKREADTPERVLALWMVAYLIPVLLTCMLHLVKLRMVRKATQSNESKSISKQGQRMTTIILFVIFGAFVFPLPRFIFDILDRCKYRYPSNKFRTIFRDVSLLLFYLNNTLNPFIYAVFSAPFRKSIHDMFRCSDKQRSEAQSRYKSMDTSSYSLASMDSPVVTRRKETSTNGKEDAEKDRSNTDEK